MKNFTLISFLVLLIWGCNNHRQNLGADNSSEKQKAFSTVGDTIYGDFDGDGKKEKAFVIQTKGNRDTSEDSDGPFTNAEWEVRFSNPKIPAIKRKCCDPLLVNEGDLFKKGMDALSINTEPENGCMNYFATYTLENANWVKKIEFFTRFSCDGMPDSFLQTYVYKEKDRIFYLAMNVNDTTSDTLTGMKFDKKEVLKNSGGLFLDLYKTYCNDSFSFCAYIPTNIIGDDEFMDRSKSLKGNGRQFISEENGGEIEAWGSFTNGSTLEAQFNVETKGIKITFKEMKKDEFIFSGLDKQGKIVYQKTAIRHISKSHAGNAQAEVFQNLRVTYPEKEKKDFKEYCRVVATSF